MVYKISLYVLLPSIVSSVIFHPPIVPPVAVISLVYKVPARVTLNLAVSPVDPPAQNAQLVSVALSPTVLSEDCKYVESSLKEPILPEVAVILSDVTLPLIFALLAYKSPLVVTPNLEPAVKHQPLTMKLLH